MPSKMKEAVRLIDPLHLGQQTGGVEREVLRSVLASLIPWTGDVPPPMLDLFVGSQRQVLRELARLRLDRQSRQLVEAGIARLAAAWRLPTDDFPALCRQVFCTFKVERGQLDLVAPDGFGLYHFVSNGLWHAAMERQPFQTVVGWEDVKEMEALAVLTVWHSTLDRMPQDEDDWRAVESFTDSDTAGLVEAPIDRQHAELVKLFQPALESERGWCTSDSGVFASVPGANVVELAYLEPEPEADSVELSFALRLVFLNTTDMSPWDEESED